jgi:uncharacterized protein (UPF0335 family)
MTEVIQKEELEQFIDKIERLEEQKAEIAEEIKSVFIDAESSGFDKRAMKSVIQLRKLDKAKLAEQEAILDLYRQALGV